MRVSASNVKIENLDIGTFIKRLFYFFSYIKYFMPRRLRYTTEQARNLLNKYGYMPPEGFEFRGINRTYTVLDEVQNRNVRVNFNTFLRRIKQNKIPEVPYLQQVSH